MDQSKHTLSHDQPTIWGARKGRDRPFNLARVARVDRPYIYPGRRDITLPDILVAVLREHRKAQLELRVRLGTGRLHDNDLLFADIDGNPISPTAFSTRWGELMERIGMPELTFHMLRHTQGVDIVTISRRLGHAKPDITLRVYAHAFQRDDSKAAAAINAILK